MNDIDLSQLAAVPDLSRPTPLFQCAGHAVYWLGIDQDTPFRCNVYLIVDGGQAILIDPGDRHHFGAVRERVAQILPPEKVTGIVVCHQDPDCAASIVDWLQLRADIAIY
jgi:flavorubredoxin